MAQKVPYTQAIKVKPAALKGRQKDIEELKQAERLAAEVTFSFTGGRAGSRFGGELAREGGTGERE